MLPFKGIDDEIDDETDDEIDAVQFDFEVENKDKSQLDEEK